MSDTLLLYGVGIIKLVRWGDDLGGGFHVVGKLAIIDPAYCGLYDCRVGIWRKFRADGSIAWEIDYKGGEG